MANAVNPFICIQKKAKSTVNISGLIHVIMLKPRDDESAMMIELAILGRNARHIKANSQREENTNGRRPMRGLSAIKMRNAAIRIKVAGNATWSRMVEFMVMFFLFLFFLLTGGWAQVGGAHLTGY